MTDEQARQLKCGDVVVAKTDGGYKGNAVVPGTMYQVQNITILPNGRVTVGIATHGTFGTAVAGMYADELDIVIQYSSNTVLIHDEAVGANHITIAPECVTPIDPNKEPECRCNRSDFLHDSNCKYKQWMDGRKKEWSL